MEMCDEEDALSGEAQGTVFATILFLIMILDIEKEVKESIIQCFADDTRLSNMISA